MPIPQLKKTTNKDWQNYRRGRTIRPKSPGRVNNQPNVWSKKSDPKQTLKKLFRRLLWLGAWLIALILIWIFFYVAWISRDLPNPNQLIDREIAQSTKIYDRSGEHVLYEISGDEKRTLVSLAEIPDHVKQATISIEDKNFYKHSGFSVWAMFRTAITNVVFRRSAGGSTLTQQFIKNAVLSPEKTFSRKIKELIMAYRLEKKFSKDEILQMYLNEIPYGSNAYGVEAASQKYFGKSVRDASLAEAAVLAAIVQTPTRYSPWGPNKDVLLSRKNYVLDLMTEQAYISATERDLAKEEIINFKGPETNIIAPHFVMYIRDILATKYGEKMVEQEGLKIYTTLDLYKQRIAEEIIKEKTENYPERYQANNAAMTAIDPKTGEILVMVGSRNYFDNSIDGQVNVTTRPRQPGSSMKPLVYAALFEKGYTPDTILYDVLTDFSTNPAEPYQPRNYDNKEYGPVSVRQALAGSLNIPAVKAIYLADINNVIDLAENMGYSTLYPRNRFGLALVLGGAEVRLLEHTNAYSAFARDGEISSISGILRVEDRNGKIIEENKPISRRVISSQVARMINSILSDNEARSFIFGSSSPLNIPGRPVAAKTGTTNNYRDAWTVGYTPSLVAGVWVGNNDNKEMKQSGSMLAAPIWKDFMLQVLGDTPIENFKEPDDYRTGKDILDGQIPKEIIEINIATGERADENTPSELKSEVYRTVHHNILYYVDKNDPRGPRPNQPEADPQFSLWERAVERWAKDNAQDDDEPTEINPDQNQESNRPVIIISRPLKNQVISSNILDVLVEGGAPRGIDRVDYYLNNVFWLSRDGHPQAFNEKIDFLNNGYHSLRAIACDNYDVCGENIINFNLNIPSNPIGSGKNSVSITSPINGLAASNHDWPLNIYFSVDKPRRLAEASVLFRKNESEVVTTIEILNSLQTNNQITWGQPPPSGVYFLFLQGQDWTGDIIKSEEVKITIN